MIVGLIHIRHFVNDIDCIPWLMYHKRVIACLWSALNPLFLTLKITLFSQFLHSPAMTPGF